MFVVVMMLRVGDFHHHKMEIIEKFCFRFSWEKWILKTGFQKVIVCRWVVGAQNFPLWYTLSRKNSIECLMNSAHYSLQRYDAPISCPMMNLFGHYLHFLSLNIILMSACEFIVHSRMPSSWKYFWGLSGHPISSHSKISSATAPHWLYPRMYQRRYPLWEFETVTELNARYSLCV